MNKQVEIDILEFVKTGKFDCLKLGQTKEWILNNFIAPDSRYDDAMIKNRHNCDIWTYGKVELHFNKQELFLIYTDYWPQGGLDGGAIKFKKWIFENINELKLGDVLEALNTENIDFKKKTDACGVRLGLESGVEMTFENESELENVTPSQFQMTSFCLIEKMEKRWTL